MSFACRHISSFGSRIRFIADTIIYNDGVHNRKANTANEAE